MNAWQRYKISLQYVGTPFCGWQGAINPSKPSVQHAFEAAVARFVGEDNFKNCQISSRTDAGVHAYRNVLHIDLRRRSRQIGEILVPHDPSSVRGALNSLLQHRKIRVLGVDAVDDGFHARFHAIGRTYVYKISEETSPFYENACWCVHRPVDLDAIKDASVHLLGQHDFSSFRGSDCQAKSPIKNISSVEVEHVQSDFDPTLGGGRLIHIKVRAPSFLYHMVRNIVGALLDVGIGKLQKEDIKRILQARDRRLAPAMAPAHGLYLADVHYPPLFPPLGFPFAQAA